MRHLDEWKVMASIGMVSLEDVDALIDWKLHRRMEGTTMRQGITIELGVDFIDKEKFPELVKIACGLAVTLKANAQLLTPTCKPECMVFTDDFMAPPKKIDMYENLVEKGQQEMAAVGGDDVTGEVTTPIDADLLKALKECG
jgi:hypothetical protein